MSTKVYVAYKIRPHITKNHVKFWKWVRDTIARGEKEVQAVLRTVYAEMLTNVQTDSEEYTKHRGENEDSYFYRLSFCHDTLVREFKRQETSLRRDPFDFNVTIAIRELHGELYLIPHCDMLVRNTLDFLKEDRRLTDFAYWNNVDPPEGMQEGSGHRRWKARGHVWDLLNEKGWRDYLLITICDFQKFMYVDPWLDMTHEHHDAQKKTDLPKES